MSATNSFETALLNLIFNGTTIAGIADNTALAPYTAYYISLHTADPGETGSQSTSETSYGSYARVAVNRNSGGWTVSGNQASNTAEIDFAQNTSGTPTITHVGLGTDASGTGTLLLSNALSTPLVMQLGMTPLFSIGQLVFTVD
jgi:hypothetical protein